MNNKNSLIVCITAAAILLSIFGLLYLLDEGVVSPARLWRLDALSATWRYLLSFVGVWLTYIFSKSFVAVSPAPETWGGELKHYLICVAACGFIAYGSAVTLGTHKEDSDPVFGGGETVVDYEPTQDQRTKHGLVAFLCLCIPALYGTHHGLQEEKDKRRKSSTC